MSLKQILLANVLLLSGITVAAQMVSKPTIDTSMFDKWPDISVGQLTPDGNYVFYLIDNEPLGQKTFILRSTHADWQRRFLNLTAYGQFTADSKYFIYQNSPDSLCFLRLG